MSSISTLNMWEKCPYSVKLKNDNFPKQQLDILDSGVVAHNFLLKYGKHLIETNLYEDFEWFKKQRDLIFKTTISSDIKNAIWNAFDQIKVADPDNTFFELGFCIDNNFKALHWDDPNAFFRGRIDMAVLRPENKTAMLIDFKTGRGRNSDPKQLLWYAAIILKLREDIDQVETKWIYTRKTHQHEPEEIDGPSLNRRGLDDVCNDIIKRISEIHEGLKSGNCPAVINDNCMSCLYNISCPKLKEAAKESEVLELASNPKEAYESMVYHKTQYDLISKMIKKHIDSVGPITVESGVYDNVGSEVLNIKKEYKKKLYLILEDIAKALDIGMSDIVNVLSLSSTDIKNLEQLVSNPELWDKILNEYFETKIRKKYACIMKEE